MHPSLRNFGEGGDIVIVDDNPANLRLLSVVLRDKGHHVRSAINAKIAISAIRAQHPDLVILDITMPEMNGIELCRVLRADPLFVDLPVIFLSALDGLADKSEAFELGGVDYVTKPFKPEELLLRVRTHLAIGRLKRQLELANRELEERVRARTEQLSTLNAAYATFVPHDGLRLLGKSDILDLRLGDHVEAEMTIMFADIEGFTALAESMPSSRIFALINDYLSHVGPVVREHRGFIDKYIGDAIMALFPRPDDAVDAAVALLGALAEFNRSGVEVGAPTLSIGIGIHCGVVSFGILGENQRMQGTVIGDAVNVAARIEGLTRRYGAGILISEAVKSRVTEDTSRRYRLIDKVSIRGRRGSTVVWEILAPAVAPEHSSRLGQLEAYNRGLEAFGQGHWAEAQSIFRQILAVIPEDEASRSYLERASDALVRSSGEVPERTP